MKTLLLFAFIVVFGCRAVFGQDTNEIYAAANKQFVVEVRQEIKLKLEMLPYQRVLAADTNIDNAVYTLFPKATVSKHYRLVQGVWLERVDQTSSLEELRALSAKLGSTNVVINP